MDLDQLAQRENEIEVKLLRLSGPIEDRIRQVSQLGVEDQYRDIFAGYTALLSDPAQALEALKRCSFLAWYAFNEPTWLSGIGQLSEQGLRKVMETIDAALVDPVSDPELEAMLRYYVRVCEVPFNLDRDLRNLQTLVVSAQDATGANNWRTSNTDGRGQMGRYWSSLRSDV
jgi:hypothetical protein